MSFQATTALAATSKAAAATLTNDELIAFLFGGKAIFTLFNEETATRFTYLVELKAYTFKGRNGQPVEGSCYWVSLLTGPQNTRDYTYLGSLKNATERTFGLSPKSKVGQADLASVQAVSWLLGRIQGFEQGRRADVTSGGLKFYHTGRCARCSKTLTTPASLTVGFGPECYGYTQKGIVKQPKVTHIA